MIRIAHRGNLTGPDVGRENEPNYVAAALALGYHVEVDARLTKDGFFLGHDEPQHKVDRFFFQDARVWTHCKNVEAFLDLSPLANVNCFFQEEDDITLTSRGFQWVHWKCNQYGPRSVVVRLGADFVPGAVRPHGVCSDFVASYPGEAHKGLPFDLLVCDIDGVLTDGKSYGLDGRVISKQYCDLDFTAIKRFRAAGIQVCFLSGDKRVNEAMAASRRVDFFHNPAGTDKVDFLPDMARRYGANNIAYVGDDYYDTTIMAAVATSFCPESAPLAVRRIATHVIPVKAGDGVLAGIYDLYEDVIPYSFPRDSADVNPR